MPLSYTPPPNRNTPRPYNNITEGLAGNPDVVLVNYPSNGYDVYSVDEIMYCLRTIRQAAIDAGKPCYITTTQPRSEGESYRTAEVRLKMAQVKDRVLAEFGVYAIDFWNGIVNTADNSIEGMYNSGDGVHLNSAGHHVLFSRVAEKNIFDQQIISDQQQGGLQYRVYQGDWNALPNFSALSPVKSGNSANVDMNVRPAGVNDFYGFVWEGYINITTPGMYTFKTASDDGSKLYFNTHYSPSATAVVNNDGLHGWQEASGMVNIPTAGRYPITITYFEKTGGDGILVSWSGPGFGMQPISDAAFTTSTTSTPPVTINPASALSYRVYQGDWTALPDFSALTPVKSGNSANVDVNEKPAGVHDFYGFVWEGYINITTPGLYTFQTASDDGSKLYFNTHYSPSATAVVNNDGLHGWTEASGTVNIPTAGRYPIAITFFENAGGDYIEVRWSGPGFGMQRIPDAAFMANAGAVPGSAITAGSMMEQVQTGSTAITRTYPNPVSDMLNIDLYNKSSSNNIGVGIYDLNGKLVYNRNFVQLPVGNNNLKLNISGSGLTPGIYMVRLQVNGIPAQVFRVVKAAR